MDQDIELRHLRYFIAVAEELHFGRAAQRLHLAQPPLSQQIRRLEEMLGYALFTRTSRSVRLTVAGETLLHRAHRTLRSVQRDIDETRSIGSGDVGSLHVGFIGSGMLSTLPSIFRTYRRSYPRVQLHLHESFTARVLEGIENGTLDTGILRDSDPLAGLEITPLYAEPFIALLPATHRCAGQKSLSLAMLRDDPFIYYPRAAGTRAFEKPLALCEAHGFRPQITQEASHWMTILGLISAGLGVSIGPACVRRIAPRNVVCLPLRGEKARSQVELAWRSGDSRPVVERFARIARGTRPVHMQRAARPAG